MDWLQEFEHDPRLREVARAIASGTPVDWAALESSATDDSFRVLVRRLRAIAKIVDAHANLQAPTPAEPVSPDGPANGPTATVTLERSDLEPKRPLPTWGPLVLHERIGEGSFGEVFRAWDPRLDREVALKLLRPGRHGDGESVGAAVVAEGRALARVRHPNVVTVYGADRIDGRVGVWMEYVHGRTLAELLRERGPFSAHEAVGAGLDVCRALAAVHRAGLLHRDVKAQNVMREEGGRCVLTDFGTAAPGGPDSEEVDALAGTPPYLAPEVVEGAAPTVQSDVYSVGVLLFHLVTGAFPVQGRRFRDIREAHRAGRRTLLRSVRPELPDRFLDVVERAMSTNPADRPATAAALERSLVHVLVEQQPERDEPASTAGTLPGARVPEAVPGRAPRVRRVVVPAVVAAAALAVGAGYVADLGGLRSRLSASRSGEGAASGMLIARRDSGEIRMRRVPIPPWIVIGRPDPGGRYLPYVTSNQELATFDVATSATRVLIPRTADEAPYWCVPSQDGRRIAYTWEALDGTLELRTVNLDDGWVELVRRFPDARDLSPWEWSHDDRAILAKVVDKGGKPRVVLADVASKQVRALMSFDVGPTNASLSPDERYLVFDRPSGQLVADRDIVLHDLVSGLETPLTDSDGLDVFPQWNDAGNAVFFVSDRTGTPSAWLQPVNGGLPDGPPLLAARNLGAANSLALARTGAFYYLLHSGMMDVFTGRLDDPGSIRSVSTSDVGQNETATWSPDGTALAWISQVGFVRGDDRSYRAIRIRKIDTGETRTLRPRLDFYRTLLWSPAGDRLLVPSSNEQGVHGIFTVDVASGLVSPVVLDPLAGDASSGCPQWLPDGRGILFARKGALWKHDLVSGAEEEVFTFQQVGIFGLHPSPAGACVQVSPDGKSLAFSGQRVEGDDVVSVVMVRNADGATREVAHGGKGEMLVFQTWLPDGSGLLLVRRPVVNGDLDEARTRHLDLRGHLLRVSAFGGELEPTGVSFEGLRTVTLNSRTGALALTAGFDRWELWVMENFLR